MTALAAIADLLRARLGLDPAALGPRALAHAVRRRSAARGVDGPDAYLAALDGDSAEWAALLEAVVVPETWFFRDREPFALLARWAARDGARRDPLAVLSLPCATGEEAWSIAIALAAAGVPPAAFRVDALDVSERALAVARSGCYTARALRRQPLDPAWARYLRPRPDGQLEVAPELHGSVCFAPGNLVDARRELADRRFDCVFSRNLLIYCDAATRAAAIATFAEVLRPDGLLFLGHAETLPIGTPGFVREGTPGAFAWRRVDAVQPRRSGPRRARTTAPLAAPRAIASVPRKESRGPRGEARNGTEKAVSERRVPRSADAALTLARQLADGGRLADAATLAAARLAKVPDDAAAHALLGIVHAAQGHDDEAAEHLRRALYLDPAREETLLHLALVLERRGERAAAARLRQRARRLENAR